MKATLIKNFVVAATLALAALATWAVTGTNAPAIHAASQLSPGA